MKNLQAYISKILNEENKTLSRNSQWFSLQKPLIYICFSAFLFSFSAQLTAIAKISLPATANLIDCGNDRLKRKEYSEATEFFRKALEKDLNNPIVHFSLGVSYLGDKDLDLATEHFLRAIELNPAMLEAYYSLALCYQMQGKKELALNSYRQGLGIDLNNKLPRSIFWNEVVLSNNEDDESRSEIIAFNNQEAEENNGTSLHFPKADFNENQNNIFSNIYSEISSSTEESYKEELQEYLTELKKNPNDSQIIYRIGLFYLKEKNYQKAYQIEKRLEKLDEYLATEIKNKLGNKFHTYDLANKADENNSQTYSGKIYSKPPEVQSTNERKTAGRK